MKIVSIIVVGWPATHNVSPRKLEQTQTEENAVQLSYWLVCGRLLNECVVPHIDDPFSSFPQNGQSF
ncbi:uncharacterized protein isoform X2 [Leptinotarsa decemlineata]|uniref:uncharacterized protein isoform X2 n=1 Tax=Leptinotarsa decemlineata TaxID=7539 RepID=UPI003D305B50